jgi:chromosome condensin MukBEF ATPase and DNA-binding subunit MukB
MFAKEDRIWAYVTSLENRMNTMQGEIDSLKGQLATATQALQQQQPPQPQQQQQRV